MKLFIFIFAALTFSILTTFGADTNAAGIWKWSLAGQNGETLLILKQDGNTLTGSYTNQFGKAEIADGTFKESVVSFKVKRELNGEAFVVKYSGKLSGDKITGKCEFDVNGQTRGLEWEAKRDTAKSATVSGNWNTVLIIDDSNRIEGVLKLKQDGDKLTGATVRNENETPIQDGKVAGDEITFNVTHDRDGRKIMGKYKAKITGDSVKGNVETDWSGDWQTFNWEGRRGK